MPAKARPKASKVPAPPVANPARTSTPTARLGADLEPARRGEPINLIIARSRIVAGGVRLELQAPSEVQGYPGAKLLVKHAYRLQEDSPQREEYRFLLRSRLGNKEHAPSLARFGDVYGVPEDIGGFLVHEHVLPASGEVVLAVEVGAEYTVGSWKSTDVDRHDVQQAQAEIRIRVT